MWGIRLASRTLDLLKIYNLSSNDAVSFTHELEWKLTFYSGLYLSLQTGVPGQQQKLIFKTRGRSPVPWESPYVALSQVTRVWVKYHSAPRTKRESASGVSTVNQSSCFCLNPIAHRMHWTSRCVNDSQKVSGRKYGHVRNCFYVRPKRRQWKIKWL